MIIQRAPKDTGVSMIHVAKQISDLEGAGAPQYDAPERVPEAINVKVSPQNYADKFYSDDSLSEVFSGTTGAQISMTIAGADRRTRRAVLGLDKIPEDQKYEEGDFSEDSQPVAFGYRRRIHGLTDDGRQKYRYVWILRVVFVQPDENSSTKAEKVSVEPGQWSGESMPLASFKPRAVWRTVMDNWEAGITQEDEDNFFKRVIYSKDGPPPEVPSEPPEG